MDLAAYEALEALGWKRGDTLLSQQSYALTDDEQKDFPSSKSIKSDFVLVDLQGTWAKAKGFILDSTSMIFYPAPAPNLLP